MGGAITLNATKSDATGKTVVTLTFSGSLVETSGSLTDGNYDLRIDASKIARGGRLLDGDKDGVDGGDFLFGRNSSDNLVETDNFFSLFGDSDGDGEVGTADLLKARRAFGKHPGEQGWNAAFDFDNNLEIGSADLLRVRRAFSKTRGSF